MPWLYYLDETADRVLTNTGITQQFTFPSSQLDFVVAAYALNGSYYGTSSVTGGVLQLCKNSASVLDAAYLFGTNYKQSVSNHGNEWHRYYFFINTSTVAR